MRLRNYILSLVILTSSLISAQTGVAKYAGEFISIGVGGRPMGMGGAYTAIANDVGSAYYNPAGLANLDYPQISLMHDERYGDLVNYNYAALAIPYGAQYTFAVSAMRLGVDKIFDTRNALIDRVTGQVIYDITLPSAKIDPTKIKEFSNQDWVVYLSGAKRENEKLYYGANVKVIYRKIGDFSATGIGVDVGALYKLDDMFTLGANLQDATTTLVAWSTGRNELISPTLKLGGASNLSLWLLNITAALDFDVRFENRKYASHFNMGPVSFDPHAGLELGFRNLFAIRAGYNDVKQFTLGAGVHLPKLNIDYTFARFNMSEDDRLPDTHRISLILTLEEPRFMRKY
ncbi:MAG: PorV/PorQ family protein [Ignavibacteriaceae bacterium]|nr:PorV/PorQ family protein [Ignavibacteriaceae bacterium]